MGIPDVSSHMSYEDYARLVRAHEEVRAMAMVDSGPRTVREFTAPTMPAGPVSDPSSGVNATQALVTACLGWLE